MSALNACLLQNANWVNATHRKKMGANEKKLVW